jgi:hypothetical protein
MHQRARLVVTANAVRLSVPSLTGSRAVAGHAVTFQAGGVRSHNVDAAQRLRQPTKRVCDGGRVYTTETAAEMEPSFAARTGRFG